MATEVLRPTAHNVASPTVTNPELGYNADLGDYATLEEATLQGVAGLTVYDFPAGSIDPSLRTSVSLTVAAEWGSADSNDKARVFFRKDPLDAWTELDVAAPPSGWNPVGSGPNSRVFDVTAIAAAVGADAFQVGLEFYNGTPAFPDPPPDYVEP